ncbi:hypothetical protein PR001_g23599 [Phytophthora rubi]|nr:hypothetical protein PR002_g23605 [Phytophthora rubi]KAE8982877.1 hypothetical protein PR001_g23599 [Phytophthora rubi]
MPTILERLRAEREAKAAEEARPAFTGVDEVRECIERATPDAKENVSLEMCVLEIDEEDKRWSLELIDRELETQFDAIANEYKGLDISRRNQYIFHLSMWKNHRSVPIEFKIIPQ